VDKPFILEKPLIVMFKQDGDIVCHLHGEDMTYEGYGLLIADLVRHVARAFKVDEDDVWEWVDKERHHQTTTFSSPS
jgi:hypothetical protein